MKEQGRGDGEEKQYGMVGRALNGVLIVSQSLSSFLTLSKITGPLFNYEMEILYFSGDLMGLFSS